MPSTVKTLLSRKSLKGVISIKPDSTVLEALEVMAQYNVGALLVMENEKLRGIFSERDYVRKGIIQGRKANSTQIKELMTHNVISVSSDMNVKDCMEIMSARKFRHLPVIDDEIVMGILSIGDIVTAVLNDQKQHINYLENYIAS
ncbi:MAG: CBS domain-containing protein [Leadbetterella sp.]